MRKIMLLAAMLAMVLVVAAPAMAQVEQGFEQDTDSGDVDQSFTVAGGGSNGNSCTPLSGSSQTGNVQGSEGFLQSDDSEIEEFEQDEVGNDLTLNSSNSTECEQEVNQAAAAGAPKAAPAPAPKAAPAPAPAPKAAPAPAPAPKAAPAPAPKAAPAPAPKAAPAPAPKAEEQKAEEQKAEEQKAEAPKAEEKKAEEKKKELPETGGSAASLFALGAGTLLVAGGLLARRLTK
jgi:LPXTG-motif cell wall-anchored protein